jgi:hypothetical protein
MKNTIFGTVTIIPFYLLYMLFIATFSVDQGYLELAKQDNWLLNLWYVREDKIYILEYRWHILTVQESVCINRYSNLFYH